MVVEYLLAGTVIFAIAIILRTWYSRSRAFQLRLKETERKILLSEREREKREALERFRGLEGLPDPPKGVQGLAQYLVQRREYAESEEREEQQRRARLFANWELISSEAARAIELVNTTLATLGELRLEPKALAFVGPDNHPVGYGIEIAIEDGGGSALAADDIYIVAYEDHVSVDDPFGDGEHLSLQGLTAERIADEMAERVKGLLDG